MLRFLLLFGDRKKAPKLHAWNVIMFTAEILPPKIDMGREMMGLNYDFTEMGPKFC